MVAKEILVQRMSWNIQRASNKASGFVDFDGLLHDLDNDGMPTNTFYFHWLPHIYAKLNSNYFGKQGFISPNSSTLNFG